MSPREIVDYLGQEMDKERILASEAKSGLLIQSDLLNSSDHSEEVGFFKKVLEKDALQKINHAGLKNVFEIIGSKCGVIPEKLNYAESEVEVADFKSTNDNRNLENLGFFSQTSNRIYLNSRSILSAVLMLLDRTTTLDRSIETRNNLLLVFALRVIIHEKIHAISFNRLEELVFGTMRTKANLWMREHIFHEPIQASFDRVRAGYAEHEILLDEDKNGEPVEKAKHVQFDEAVTEKMTSEILREYLLRYCNDKFTKKQIDELVVLVTDNDYHKKDNIFLDEIIKGLAEYLGLSPEVVWQGFVRSKIEGVDLTDLDVKPIFDAVQAREDLVVKKTKDI
ncbi:MAG: hypothetical protein A2538_01230 [Candidatus Magasanikbacteria bacterium RIFOXYD2_FULL_41_14]|uniref:Uncharacterized protein n=1 Tax=Candidatus Magasanikbacteria bacterium RIFOXYD2_FULL_41_14 TaxID=1798709 RepID=A0A1F6PBV4_9BACT|nr:MAG: hypothetical protein A2538_01230 [Candidatus Magasanikbacteria bacterium RIFOXYD2_FULL_41_14]